MVKQKQLWNRVCVNCGTSFETTMSQKVHCDSLCRKESWRKRYTGVNDLGKLPKLPSNKVGAMTEIFVSAYLLERGFDVFRAMSPSSSCDLIIIKDKKSYRVEVRTGSYNSTGKLQIHFSDNDLGRSEILAIRARDGSIFFYESKLPTNRDDYMDVSDIIDKIQKEIDKND